MLLLLQSFLQPIPPSSPQLSMSSLLQSLSQPILPLSPPPRSHNTVSSDEEERSPRKKQCLNCTLYCPKRETA
ncbi:hypothetical protein Glove_586g42 [Diversispora epigaea]|uniref:Uncharacterized protein n=1 Tax=Diversispora epigaea TaxID=1348612 RepID=A0A397G8B0_9GLOM|nr:hypothetical protein Glove_586g42 [Diversispora epigaea]